MMRKPRKQFGPALVPQAEPAIEWRDYPLIESREYPAYCRCAKQYRDPAFSRWTCLLLWDVLTDDLLTVIASVPCWLCLGERDKPRASRRGKYLKEWVRANGGPPNRGDRLSPRIFARRMARVKVGETDQKKSPVPYSVVTKIISWETGSLSHQVTQSRKAGDKPEQSKQLSEANGKTISARAGVEGCTTPSHTQGAGVPILRLARQRQGLRGDAAD